jgi:hypothetical protein
MSYKHVGTAADLVRFGCSLRVECTHCGAAATMSAAEAVQVHGRARLGLLPRRLKCSRCGRTAAKLTVLDPL